MLLSLNHSELHNPLAEFAAGLDCRRDIDLEDETFGSRVRLCDILLPLYGHRERVSGLILERIRHNVYQRVGFWHLHDMSTGTASEYLAAKALHSRIIAANREEIILI